MSGSNRETILKEMFNNQKLKKWSGDGGIALTHTQHISQSEPAKRLLAGRAEGNSKEGANGAQDKVQSSWHLKSDLAVVDLSWVLTFFHRTDMKFVTLQEILTKKQNKKN